MQEINFSAVNKSKLKNNVKMPPSVVDETDELKHYIDKNNAKNKVLKKLIEKLESISPIKESILKS